MSKIQGIPDGYELVRVGRPECGELFLTGDGKIAIASGQAVEVSYVILRRIEKPKAYRPFASAEEFKPHRGKWWMRKGDVQCSKYPTTYPPAAYNDVSHGGQPWGDAFENRVFEDGSPFGVEVTE